MEERKKGGGREDIQTIPHVDCSVTSYLNQFEQVLKVLLIIHCDPTPFISQNTIMLHLVFITVCTCTSRGGKEREMGGEGGGRRGDRGGG